MYSKKVEPMTKLTKKDELFVCGSEQQFAFETVVTAFPTEPALRHFDHQTEVIIETDTSDYVSAEVVSQRDNEGVLRLMAY
jgi:hypothetical protein